MADQTTSATADPVADSAAGTAAAPIANDPQGEIQRLIESTTSLNSAEKEYWLNLLPTMNAEQIEQLRGILETEQQNLAEIDKKYDEKLEGVAQKYLHKWDNEKAQEERAKRREEELKGKEEDVEKAEDLLAGWE